MFRNFRKLWYKYERKRVYVLFTISLFIMALLMIFLGGLLAYLTNKSYFDGGLLQAFWWAFMRVTDPGYLNDDYTAHPFVAFLSTIITIFGFAIFGSSIIGIISDKLRNMVEDIKQGTKNLVFENHIVILGWNNKIYSSLSELIINDTNNEIAILSSKEKEEADILIDKLVWLELNEQNQIKTKKERIRLHEENIVYREGNQLLDVDLLRVNVEDAKCIIILAEEELFEDAQAVDMRTIKTILAVRKMNKNVPLIVEVLKVRNRLLVELAAGKNVLALASRDIIARILTQTSLQSGLYTIYQELFSFQGEKLCFKDIGENKELFDFGKTYNTQKMLESFLRKVSDEIPIGMEFNNQIYLNRRNWRFEKGNRIITITTHKKPFKLHNIIASSWENISKEYNLPKAPPISLRLLILGSNHKLPIMLEAYSHYIQQYKEGKLHITLIAEEVDKKLVRSFDKIPQLKITYKQLDFTISDKLKSVLRKDKFNAIIILTEDAKIGETVQQVDTKVFIGLLILQSMQNQGKLKNVRIIAEILDPQNQELINIDNVDDVVIGNHLISMIIAQVACEAELNNVFYELFDFKGSEIYLRNVEHYFKLDDYYSFYDIMRKMALYSQIAFGVKIISEANNPTQNFGIHLNPLPKEKLWKFNIGDQIIVLAKN